MGGKCKRHSRRRLELSIVNSMGGLNSPFYFYIMLDKYTSMIYNSNCKGGDYMTMDNGLIFLQVIWKMGWLWIPVVVLLIGLDIYEHHQK